MYLGKWNQSDTDYKALINLWHVVEKINNIPLDKPYAAKLLGENIVIWRSQEGIQVWKDYCGHRGAKLSLGKICNNEIMCPYHGWRFNTAGKCTIVPAHPNQNTPNTKKVVFPYKAQEKYGYVWACLGEPITNIPDLPEWDNSEYRKVYAGPYYYKGNALRSVENFLDATHFPFIHANLNGDPDSPDEIQDYTIENLEFGIRTSEIKVFQPYGDHRGIPVDARYIYSVFSPTTAYFRKRTGETETFCTFLTATPVDVDETIIWLIVAINYGPELTEEKILYRQDMVFEQDRVIVESQRPVQLPLDPKEEMHVRSDRFSLAYRRWIKELGSY